jgi:hypothetical protein
MLKTQNFTRANVLILFASLMLLFGSFCLFITISKGLLNPFGRSLYWFGEWIDDALTFYAYSPDFALYTYNTETRNLTISTQESSTDDDKIRQYDLLNHSKLSRGWLEQQFGEIQELVFSADQSKVALITGSYRSAILLNFDMYEEQIYVLDVVTGMVIFQPSRAQLLRQIPHKSILLPFSLSLGFYEFLSVAVTLAGCLVLVMSVNSTQRKLIYLALAALFYVVFIIGCSLAYIISWLSEG